ncbi:hypothetical protein B4Q13_18435, partial [Lacticaseibacillus rhamnosus]
MAWEQATGEGKVSLQPTAAAPRQDAIPVAGSADVDFQGIPLQVPGRLHVNIAELTALDARLT